MSEEKQVNQGYTIIESNKRRVGRIVMREGVI